MKCALLAFVQLNFDFNFVNVYFLWYCFENACFLGEAGNLAWVLLGDGWDEPGAREFVWNFTEDHGLLKHLPIFYKSGC